MEAWKLINYFFPRCRRIIRGLPAFLQCKYQKQNNHETSKQMQKNGAKTEKTQPNNFGFGLILIASCLLVCVFFLRRIHKFFSNSSFQPIPFPMQTRTHNPQALWPAVCHQERLLGTRILLPQDFCSKTMQAVTERAIKKIKFFEFFRVSSGTHPLTKKPEDSEKQIVPSAQM